MLTVQFLYETETTPVAPPPVKEEPEKIRKWREEQKARLEEKGIENDGIVKLNVILSNSMLSCSSLCANCLDAEEEKKKEEWREAAKKELEEWYKHHAEAINKTKTTNR